MTVTPSTRGVYSDTFYFSHEQKGGEGQPSEMSRIEVSGGECLWEGSSPTAQ